METLMPLGTELLAVVFHQHIHLIITFFLLGLFEGQGVQEQPPPPPQQKKN
jgi:hypothetical protein